MFSLICAWINGWANNGDAGDLRRHRAHHDVIVMKHAHHGAVVMQSNVHRFKLNRPVYPCSSGLSVIIEVILKERGIPTFMETQRNMITCESIRLPHKYCRFTKSLLTHLPLDKMVAISQTIFSNIFSWMKCLYFDYNFAEVCSQGSYWQYPRIGLGNVLAPNRRKAIIWTNADHIHCRIYAALRGDELNMLITLLWLNNEMFIDSSQVGPFTLFSRLVQCQWSNPEGYG